MDTVDALASKAHIHALALRLRRAGLPGTLDQLRLLVFADLTAGRDPLDRLTRSDANAAPAEPGGPDPSGPGGGDTAPAILATGDALPLDREPPPGSGQPPEDDRKPHSERRRRQGSGR